MGGYRSFALEGFSEDLNQDGFVDPIAQAVPLVQHVAPLINYAASYALPPNIFSYAAAHTISHDALNPVEAKEKSVKLKAAPAPVPENYAVSDSPFQIPKIAIRSLNGCPYQVKVSRTKGTDDTKGPYKLLKEYYGTYTIQPGTVNGRDWYKKGDHVISYCGKNWNVASEESLGECQGAFFTWDDDECPHEPGYTWKYFVSAIDEWVDAGKSMSIWSDS